MGLTALIAYHSWVLIVLRHRNEKSCANAGCVPQGRTPGPGLDGPLPPSPVPFPPFIYIYSVGPHHVPVSLSGGGSRYLKYLRPLPVPFDLSLYPQQEWEASAPSNGTTGI
jgi:hypothetical protein